MSTLLCNFGHPCLRWRVAAVFNPFDSEGYVKHWHEFPSDRQFVVLDAEHYFTEMMVGRPECLHSKAVMRHAEAASITRQKNRQANIGFYAFPWCHDEISIEDTVESLDDLLFGYCDYIMPQCYDRGEEDWRTRSRFDRTGQCVKLLARHNRTPIVPFVSTVYADNGPDKSLAGMPIPINNLKKQVEWAKQCGVSIDRDGLFCYEILNHYRIHATRSKEERDEKLTQTSRKALRGYYGIGPRTVLADAGWERERINDECLDYLAPRLKAFEDAL